MAKRIMQLDEIKSIFSEEMQSLFEDLYSETGSFRKGLRSFLKNAIPELVCNRLGLSWDSENKISLPRRDRYGNLKDGLFYQFYSKYESSMVEKARLDFSKVFENVHINVELNNEEKQHLEEHFKKCYLVHFENEISAKAEQYATDAADEFAKMLMKIEDTDTEKEN